MKKNMKTSMWKTFLCAIMLLVGVQSAFATCSGTLHFKRPDNWRSSFVVFAGSSEYLQLLPSALNSETGYYDYDLAKSSLVQDEKFALASSKAAPMNYVLDSVWNGQTAYDSNYPLMYADIVCPNINDATDVWVMENPKKPGTTLVSYTEPKVKYFYVLPPDNMDWLSSTPMWSSDGTYASRQPFKVDPTRCGWYYMVWLDEPLPEKMVVFRDDDTQLNDAIGMNGWGADLSPIRVQDVFDAADANSIYFIADFSQAKDYGVEQISTTDPAVDGTCYFNLAAIIYDTDASMHGAFTCDAYPTVASNGCYNASAPYNYPGSGSMNTIPCIGVTRGIVKSDLDPVTKKPTYNSASGCFVSQEAFDVIFRETPDVNVKHCRDITFGKDGNGLWGYDSYNEPTGAFSILNDLINSGACTGDCKIAATPREGYGNIRYGIGSGEPNGNYVSAAATKLLGPVSDWSAIEPNTGLPYIDLYPTSDGEFASGSEPNVYDNASWDERIESKNNQFFCFESHAKFTYRSGLRFYIRGDDDIWVFVDNKLAIDLGGLHMAAPGSINLDEFVGASGTWVAGQTYDLDLFFCDRRTSMSNMYIKTNMNLIQYAGSGVHISMEAQKLDAHAVQLDICVALSGGGDCASVALGASQARTECGEDIASNVYYSIVTRKGETPANCDDCGSLPLGMIVHGGIDLSNPKVPVVSSDKIVGLASGAYRLVVEVYGRKAYYDFSVDGESEEVSSSSTKASSSSGKVTSSSSGKAKSSSSEADEDDGVEFAKPSFRIKMTGPFEFAIVFDDELPAKARAYTVMDLQGNILRQGEVVSSETVVDGLSAGSYIVKSGYSKRRVNIR